MYRVDFETVEDLNNTAVRLRNRGCSIGNAVKDEVAKAMLSLIPDDWFEPKGKELVDRFLLDLDEYTNNHRVLDICCNSGMLLIHFLDKFYNALHKYKNFGKDMNDCYEYIFKNLLYGICCSRTLCQSIRGVLYNNKEVLGNIYNYDICSKVIRLGKKDNIPITCEDDSEISIRGSKVYIYDSSEKELVEMKFNVVCGNPPYNKDDYLDFVALGDNLSAEYSLWITPAKWQAKKDKRAGGKNDNFRSTIVPRISSLVFFKNPLDVFPDTPMHNDSISIYLVDKIEHPDKFLTINGASNLVKFWKIEDGFDLHSEYGSIRDKVLSKSVSILDGSSFKPQKSYFTSKNFGQVDDGTISADPDSDYFLVNASRGIRLNESYFKHLDQMGSYKCYISGYLVTCPLVNILEPNIASVRGDVLLGFGTLDECISIKSYYQSSLIWYLVYGLNMGNLNTSSFKNVPDPDSFDCIYEDRPLMGYTPNADGCYIDKDGIKHCSLYVKYGLTDKEIDVIESEVKTRNK